MAARVVEYGVGTRNMFDLLGDEDEEIDVNAKPKVVKKNEPSSNAKAPVVTSTKAPKTANKPSSSGNLPLPDEPKRVPRPDDRSIRGAANRPPRRGGRGAPAAGAPEGGGSRKRQYDRRGPRVEGDQKNGAGRYNWGNDKDQVEYAEETGGAAGEAPRRGRGGDRGRGGRGRGRGGRGRGRGGRPDDQPADAAPKEGDEAPKPEDGQEVAPAEAPVEEVREEAPVDPDEPKVKSYDEYLAEKRANLVEEDSKREIRQPDNEGEWRAFVELPKPAGGADEEKEAEKSKPKKDKKKAVPKLSLDQFVGPQPTRGRGGARGRGGRDPQRNPRAPLVDSEEAFPTLKR